MSTAKHTILVTSGGGHIGTKLVPRLLSNPNLKVILPTSNSARLQTSLPSTATSDRVVIEQGDVKDPTWIESLLRKHSVDRVFLNLTGTDELLVTLNFFDAMQRAGTVDHLVYLSACGDLTSPEGYKTVLQSHTSAHFLIKPLIEQKLLLSSYPFTHTVLGPTLFFDNDLLARESVLETQSFEHPLSQTHGASRVSTVDIALAANNTLLDPETWRGRKVMLGSKKWWTGDEAARIWSGVMGQEVQASGVDEEAFDRFESFHIHTSRDRAWARNLRLMYATFARQGFGLTEAQYDVQVECLGRPPVSDAYEDHVRELVKQWTASS